MKRWQRLADRWTKLVFGDRYTEITRKIKVLRALEEVMELAQAEGVTIEEAELVKQQVWNRPIGEPDQELGGVMVCLAGYAYTAKLDLSKAFWEEFQRIMDPEIMEKVRYRNLSGDKIGFVKGELAAARSLVSDHLGFDVAIEAGSFTPTDSIDSTGV